MFGLSNDITAWVSRRYIAVPLWPQPAIFPRVLQIGAGDPIPTDHFDPAIGLISCWPVAAICVDEMNAAPATGIKRAAQRHPVADANFGKR